MLNPASLSVLQTRSQPRRQVNDISSSLSTFLESTGSFLRWSLIVLSQSNNWFLRSATACLHRLRFDTKFSASVQCQPASLQRRIQYATMPPLSFPLGRVSQSHLPNTSREFGIRTTCAALSNALISTFVLTEEICSTSRIPNM